MTTRDLIQHARVLYNSPFVPDYVNRANRKKWVRMVMWLGPRWLLANKVQRQT